MIPKIGLILFQREMLLDHPRAGGNSECRSFDAERMVGIPNGFTEGCKRRLPPSWLPPAALGS